MIEFKKTFILRNLEHPSNGVFSLELFQFGKDNPLACRVVSVLVSILSDGNILISARDNFDKIVSCELPETKRHEATDCIKVDNL